MAGLLDKRREDREEAEIPTAGMADIAFLLLIFFLVTTTINVDTGIGMTLPPKLENQDPPPVKDRNLFKILVNDQGDMLVEGERAQIGQLRERVKKHVTNYGGDPNLSVRPEKAVISIKTEAKTPYNTYIEVLDEVWMAYREIWDQIARTNTLPNGDPAGLAKRYDSYQAYRNSLETEETNQIKKEILKAQISIAEPDTGN